MSTLNERDRENLVAYLDGELDEETAQALEAKINLDSEARAEVDTLRHTWDMLDYLPRPAASASFTGRTMQRLSLEGRAIQTGRMPLSATPWKRKVAWAAAILIAAGLGFGGGYYLASRSNDTDIEETLVRHLRAVDKLAQYQHVDDLDFLRALDHPDLFGEEGS